jgi:Protein of unknown function (DUF2934)
MPMTKSRHTAVCEQAYALWEEEGRPQGKEWAHWFRAEAEVDSADRLLRDMRDAGFTSNRAYVYLKNIEPRFIVVNLDAEE